MRRNDYSLSVLRSALVSPHARFEIHPDVRASLENGGAVLLHLSRGKYLSLNPLGAKIWQGLEEGLSESQIFGELRKDFPSIGEETIQCDLSRFLDELVEKGLVRTNGR